MRINVYTEELLGDEFKKAAQPLPAAVTTWMTANYPIIAEIVTAEYVSSRTGEKMTNYGLRIYLKSHPDLHYVPPRDDDRSAVTFWCGSKEKNVFAFLDLVREFACYSTLDIWREKTRRQQQAAEKLLPS